MARQAKIREPLPLKWRVPLLGTVDDTALNEAKQRLEEVVQDARKHLGENPLTPLTAQAVAKELGKAGDTAIAIDAAGDIWLEVTVRTRGGDKRSWSSALPALADLRAKAASLGIDTSAMGRSKTTILKAIATAESAPRRKMFKTSPAIAVLPGDGDSTALRQDEN